MSFLKSISSPTGKSSRMRPSWAMVSMLCGSLTTAAPNGPTSAPATRNAAISGIFSRAKTTASAPAAIKQMLMSSTSDGNSAAPAAHAGSGARQSAKSPAEDVFN
ncbi:MAG: hypothetical protein M5U09_10275 [Gammaproteobacteria bacterium]|nr:hypothetical protein [Gammaproteobacteria bacterium]